MAKRQVLVESITECLVESDNVRVWVKIHDENPATVNLTSKNNAGGEAWEWAQGHWPEFVPEEKEFELPSSDGTPVKIKGQVRWVCVTGIIDSKTRKPLPIEELRAGDDSHRRWGARTKGQKVKPVQIKETRSQKTKPVKRQNKSAQTKEASLSSGADEELGDVDMQVMIDEKIKNLLDG